MAGRLREDQVQRYARAILLGPVGGRGQEKLLATGARLTADGPCLITAAAYLAAGGTPVAGPIPELAPEEAGFLAPEPGRPAALVDAVASLNADAAAEPRRWGTLLSLPGDPALHLRPLVAVGSRGDAALLWAAGGDACAACLAEALLGAGAPPEGAAAAQAGALAALLFERLVLELGPPLSGMAVDSGGTVEVLPVAPCPHRGELSEEVLRVALLHLEACSPEEGCGVVLLGTDGTRFVPLVNAYARWAATDPAGFPRDARSAFLFEPAEWLALLRSANARGERLLCIVHSHPEGPAAFSAEDRAQAAPDGIPLFPGVAHLVVSLRGGRASSAAWVTWDGSAFRETVRSLSP
jgi:[CysO sulfur-carrier protein]-S-L-cysteine hydrolase